MNELHVVHADGIEGEPFESEKLKIEETYYIPEATLAMDKSSIQNWAERISYPFQLSSGENVILHLQTRYFSRWKKIDPFYAMQLNIEIPAALFHGKSDLDFKNLKTFLAWTHPDLSADGDHYVEPKKGHLKIWKLKKGRLQGWLNFEFEHQGKKIQVYGRLKSLAQSRESYLSKQENKRQELYEEASHLDH